MNFEGIDNLYSFTAFCLLLFLLLIALRSGMKLKKGNVEISFGRKPNRPRVPPLAEHHLFHDILKWIAVDVRQISVSSRIKKQLIVPFLSMYLSVSRQLIRDYVVDIEKKAAANEQFRVDEARLLLLRIMEICEEKSRSMEIKIEGRILSGLPVIFLEAFHRWHSPILEMCNVSVSQVVKNEIFPSEMGKLLAILEILFIFLRLTIIDAKESMNELNGELESYIQNELKL